MDVYFSKIFLFSQKYFYGQNFFYINDVIEIEKIEINSARLKNLPPARQQEVCALWVKRGILWKLKISVVGSASMIKMYALEFFKYVVNLRDEWEDAGNVWQGVESVPRMLKHVPNRLRQGRCVWKLLRGERR